MHCIFPESGKPAQVIVFRNVGVDHPQFQRLAEATESILVLLGPGEQMEYVALESFEKEPWEE